MLRISRDTTDLDLDADLHLLTQNLGSLDREPLHALGLAMFFFCISLKPVRVFSGSAFFRLDRLNKTPVILKYIYKLNCCTALLTMIAATIHITVNNISI